MVYKTDILRNIVTVDDNEEKVYFNYDCMNDKQKELFVNYKREIAREAISIDSTNVKLDNSLMIALNSNNVELDLTKLNPKQTFLLDCCIKELERKIDPDVYTKHKQCLKRKKNNECASKFRKKRKSFEKINEIIRSHLNELTKQCKGLDREQMDQIRNFLNANKLSITLKYFNNEESAIIHTSSSISSTGSIISSNSDSDSSSDNSNDSIRDEVENLKIEERQHHQQQHAPQQHPQLHPRHHTQQLPEIKREETAIKMLPNNNKIPISLNNSLLNNPLNGLTAFSLPQYFAAFQNSTNPLTSTQPQLQPQQQQQQQPFYTPTFIVVPNFTLPNDLVLVNQLNSQRVIIS